MAFTSTTGGGNDDGVYFYGTPGAFSTTTNNDKDTQGITVVPKATTTSRSGAIARAAGSTSSIAATANATSTAPAKVAWGSMTESLRASAPPILKGATSIAVQRSADRVGNPICSFYSSGSCAKGDSCRFRHVRAEPWAVEFFQAQLKIARDNGKAGVRDIQAGVSAFLGHNDDGDNGDTGVSGISGGVICDEAFIKASVEWSTNASIAEDAMILAAVTAGICQDKDSAEIALFTAERNASDDTECGICLETVVSAERPGRRFGLLTGCAHGFCLECIRAWRGRTDLPADTVRSCPLCRAISFYVIPCERFVADAARKARVHAAFLAQNARVSCRNWDLGRGSCPFGSSCHFAHLLPDGTEAIESGRHAFRISAEGVITGVIGKGPKLSDFL